MCHHTISSARTVGGWRRDAAKQITPPSLHHLDHPGALGARAAEQLGVGAGALVVEMVLHLPGEADGAEDLDAAVGAAT